MTDSRPPDGEGSRPAGARSYGDAGGTQGTPREDPYASQPRSNGVAVAALVIGILALVSGFIPFLGILFASVLGIIAVIAGIVGLRRAKARAGEGRGMSIAGLVMGALGVILAVLQVVGIASLFGNPEMQQQIEEFESEIENLPTPTLE